MPGTDQITTTQTLPGSYLAVPDGPLPVVFVSDLLGQLLDRVSEQRAVAAADVKVDSPRPSLIERLRDLSLTELTSLLDEHEATLRATARLRDDLEVVVDSIRAVTSDVSTYNPSLAAVGGVPDALEAEKRLADVREQQRHERVGRRG